jgi:hypothetical protein
MLKTGRYLRYKDNQQVGRLHLALLQKFGVNAKAVADSTTPLPGLDGSHFEPYRERPFQSWIKRQGDSVTVQGRLRLSEDLNEAKVFYIDVDGQASVRIEVQFRDFHDFNLAYHCGSPVTMIGTGSDRDGQLVISKVKKLTSLFGQAPGSAAG